VINLAGDEPERIDVGDAPRAVDNPVRFGGLFDALVSKNNAEPATTCLDTLDPRTVG
jgi:hypothetical protein